jgi:nucleotide-binding universal stress UspA family protein
MSATQQSATPATDDLRILVPLDGSPIAARALDIAARFPAREIVLLRVQPGGHEAEAQGIRNELEALAAPLRTGQRSVTGDVRFGDAAGEIVDAASDFDLVVMTTRGRSAAARMLFGSVADRVSRYSPTPTLLIRTSKDTGEIPRRKRIVVPLDGSELAERALPIAVRLARGAALPLHLVRAVDLDAVRATIRASRKDDAAPDPAAEDESSQTYEAARLQTEELALTYLRETAAAIGGDGLDVDVEVLRGTPSFVLVWNVQEDDLVVITSHGRGGFRRWLLGSVSEKLVREASAPVLLVPTRDSA